MRCYNCNKNFDYEKYYGICPKCGCFNRRETMEEQHEALHDRFSDSSDEECHRDHREYSSHPGEEHWTGSQENSHIYQEDGYAHTAYAGETAKKKGVGLFVFGVLFFIVSIFMLIGSAVYMAVRPRTTAAVSDTSSEPYLESVEHSPGTSFEFQDSMTLEVVECKEVADRSVLPGLKEGTKVIAVHLRGTSDGKYEDYNEIYGMYLSVDPTGYLQCISSYDFEPYAQMLGVYPALDERALKGETSCDGWIGFLVPDWVTAAVFWLDEYDCSDWDGGNLLRTHQIELSITPLNPSEDSYGEGTEETSDPAAEDSIVENAAEEDTEGGTEHAE